MWRELAAVRAAVMFFTRLPWPSHRPWDPEDLQRAAAWFPWVGALVGAFAAVVWWLAAEVAGLPPLLASGLSLAASVVLTEAFHEDGWADVCDGFGGGYTKARTLEIMKDSRIGAFGAVGLVLMLRLKWHAVASAPSRWVVEALICLHILSRTASAMLMVCMRYVAEEGKAKPLATRLRGGRLGWVMLAGGCALGGLPGDARWSVAGGVVVMTVLMARWFMSRIGGYTGDCLGAVQQGAELTGWLILVGVAR
ncbi:MAG: adenosylcobinamide-GDP ribazoletransferase [Candidatus Synoicihabitans palmerolidicus]|nr:adenosylcobinamide-GDP ribazoletransferase [Candidatus Synoicihabitans palmerolidicus]